MQATELRRLSHTKSCGATLIIMVLLIVVLCTLIWLDPLALMKGSDSDLPWNEEFRLVRHDEELQQPKQQPWTKIRLARLRPRFCLLWYLSEKSWSSS